MKKRLLKIFPFILIIFLSSCNLLSKKTYNITTNESQNGIYNISKTVASEGETITVDCNPNDGYEFDYLKINSKEIFDDEFIMPDEDVNLEVFFKLTYYNISYSLEDNIFTTPPTKTYTILDEITNFATPIKEGYVFQGWYKEPELINKVNKIEKGSKGDIILYPSFKLNEYTINYHIDDNTYNDNITKYTIEGSSFKLNDPVKDGYLFYGWYDNKEFNGEKITQINNLRNYDLYPLFISNKRDENGFRIIENELDFKYIFIDNYLPNEKYKLNCDIDLKNSIWYSREFNGEFDGGNHTISNFIIRSKNPNEGIGFFSNISNATIKNLTLKGTIDLNIRDNYNNISVGMLVGSCLEKSKNTITNVHIIDSSITLTSISTISVGGIIGQSNKYSNILSSSVINLSINLTSYDDSYVGGICGRYGNIYTSYVSLSNTSFLVTSYANNYGIVSVGGLLGEGLESEISNCYFIQDESSILRLFQNNSNTENMIAGINANGDINTTINNCYAVINKFEFEKRKVTQNCKIYIVGLSGAGHVFNSFVSNVNDNFIIDTICNDSYFTPYNDTDNEYYIAYLSMFEPVNSYAAYCDILVNNKKYLEDKIHDINRINFDLKSVFYNLFSNVWDNNYWNFYNNKYPTLKN